MRLSALTNMICIKKNFDNIRVLMLIVGLWPYQQSKIVKIQLILLSGIMLSFIVFQLTTFVTEKCTMELVIKIASTSLFCFILSIIHNSFWFNIQTVKCLFKQLQHTFNELKDKNEIAIIKLYENNMRRNAVIMTLLTIIATLIVISMPFLPQIFDIILPLNESRSTTLYFVTEYFVDKNKYFYLIMLHTNVAVCTGSIATAGIASMLFGYIKYICGMFSIASYRIEQAMMSKMLKNTTFENNIIIRKKIKNAVDIHCKAMEYCNSLVSTFTVLCFLLIATAISCLSLSLYGVLAHTSDISVLLFHFTGVLTLFIAIFLAHYVAQNVMDHNENVFMTVYNVNWYMAPLNIQKIILFLLQKGTKTFNLTIGGLFTGSLQNAASMTSTSVSYFTVLYSVT